MNRILIAEDEPRLASFLEKGLKANGFATTVVDTGPAAASLASDDDFDLWCSTSDSPAWTASRCCVSSARAGITCRW